MGDFWTAEMEGPAIYLVSYSITSVPAVCRESGKHVLLYKLAMVSAFGSLHV